MKSGLTEMIFVLDMSGSMSRLANDVIQGFNSLVEEQRQQEGEAKITTIFFDDRYIVCSDNKDIKEIELLNNKTFKPSGSTALYDAIGRTLNLVGTRLVNTDESERPEKVMFVIYTDGEENASEEFKATVVKEMIEHQQTKYNWQFLFLGCNQDAMLTAQNFGIKNYSNVSYSSSGMTQMYSAVCDTISSYRSCGTVTQMPSEIK